LSELHGSMGRIAPMYYKYNVVTC